VRNPRWLVVWAAVVLATGCVPSAPPDPATINPPEPPAVSGGPAALVDPFIGTAPAASPSPVPGGRGGDTFPGASAPFGAVQWSPDTPGAEHPSGYAYSDQLIDGFSVTHFSGAGCANGGLLSFVPRSGPGDGPLGFHHEREQARPGSYQVTLDDGSTVELAATTRAGIGRFRFPAGSTPELVVDNSLRNNGFVVPDVPLTSVVNDRTLEGVAVGGGFCGTPTRFRTYFRIEFDQPFTVVAWDPVGAVRLRFAGATGGVRARFALSGVGVEGALANLRAEVPGWSYGVVRDSTYQQWNGLLSRLTVQGGSQSARRVFTTALYHAMLHPNTGSDVDGRYLGFDGFVHRLTDGSVRYVNFSGWDIYRSQVQLLAVVVPEVARDVSRSLLADAEECGGGFPKWTIANQEASVMVGDPGAAMVAGLDAFGAGPERTDAVLAVMRRSAGNPTTQCGYWRLRPSLRPYLDVGYTPSFPVFVPDDIGRNVLDLLFDTANVSTTLEYAVADTAIGRYAARHGDPALAAATLERGGNWRNLFDPTVGFVRPRLADGSFASWWTPTGEAGFTEGNSVQYTWMAPQDFAGVVAALGGPRPPEPASTRCSSRSTPGSTRRTSTSATSRGSPRPGPTCGPACQPAPRTSCDGS
jgi:predicted alpha-1,2-mannosidase